MKYSINLLSVCTFSVNFKKLLKYLRGSRSELENYPIKRKQFVPNNNPLFIQYFSMCNS